MLDLQVALQLQLARTTFKINYCSIGGGHSCLFRGQAKTCSIIADPVFEFSLCSCSSRNVRDEFVLRYFRVSLIVLLEALDSGFKGHPCVPSVVFQPPWDVYNKFHVQATADATQVEDIDRVVGCSRNLGDLDVSGYSITTAKFGLGVQRTLATLYEI